MSEVADLRALVKFARSRVNNNLYDRNVMAALLLDVCAKVDEVLPRVMLPDQELLPKQLLSGAWYRYDGTQWQMMTVGSYEAAIESLEKERDEAQAAVLALRDAGKQFDADPHDILRTCIPGRKGWRPCPTCDGIRKVLADTESYEQYRPPPSTTNS